MAAVVLYGRRRGASKNGESQTNISKFIQSSYIVNLCYQKSRFKPLFEPKTLDGAECNAHLFKLFVCRGY